MEHARKLDLSRHNHVKQRQIVLVEEQLVTPKKRSIKKFLMRVTLFFIFAIPLFLFLQSHLATQKQIYTSKVDQVKNLTADLKKTNNEIEESNLLIKQLNDDEFIIEFARNNLFFSKEGEIIFPNIK